MRGTTFLLALALLVGVSAHAAPQDASAIQLASAVSRQIYASTQLTIFDHVDARIEDGVVALSGRVTLASKRDDVERRVRAVPGVREVRNDIGVLPPSPVDDELRQRISRAIYNNPSFWTYAAMAHPPIHIIVEHGRVTLAGVVHNETDRTLARSLAAGTGAVSVTNELRTTTRQASQL